MTLEPIPSLPDNLVDPISALVRTASFFHRLYGELGTRDPEVLSGESLEALSMFEAILEAWLDHTGITHESLMDDVFPGQPDPEVSSRIVRAGAKASSEVGDLICELLHAFYVQHGRLKMAKEAAKMGCPSAESFAAAFVTQALNERGLLRTD